MSRNPVLKENSKFSSIALRIIGIIIYIILIPIEYVIIYDIFTTNNDIAKGIFVTILFLIYTYFLWNNIFNKRNTKSLKYISKYITYKEIIKCIDGQVFNKLEGLEGIYESEKWLKIDGYFIPKNFILGVYSTVESARYGNRNCMFIVLITGEKVLYFAGTTAYNKKNPIKEKARVSLAKILPQANVYENNSIKAWYEENKKNIKIKFENYLNDGNDIKELINNWSNIIGYNFDRTGTIDDE